MAYQLEGFITGEQLDRIRQLGVAAGPDAIEALQNTVNKMRDLMNQAKSFARNYPDIWKKAFSETGSVVKAVDRVKEILAQPKAEPTAKPPAALEVLQQMGITVADVNKAMGEAKKSIGLLNEVFDTIGPEQYNDAVAKIEKKLVDLTGDAKKVRLEMIAAGAKGLTPLIDQIYIPPKIHMEAPITGDALENTAEFVNKTQTLNEKWEDLGFTVSNVEGALNDAAGALAQLTMDREALGAKQYDQILQQIVAHLRELGVEEDKIKELTKGVGKSLEEVSLSAQVAF